MRVTSAVVIVLGLSVGADAQSSLRPERRSAFTPPLPGTGLSLPPIGLPLPAIGLPLPSIGLPLPQMGLPPFGRKRLAAADGVPGDFTDRHLAFEARHRGRRSGGSMRRSSAQTIFLFLPVVGLSHPEVMTRPASASAGAEQTPAVGHVRLALQPGVVPQCQWQPKTAHLWQPKTAHSWGGRLGRSGHSPGDARRACWAGRRERSDRSPGQHAPRSCGAGGHVATPSRCSSDAVLSQC